MINLCHGHGALQCTVPPPPRRFWTVSWLLRGLPSPSAVAPVAGCPWGALGCEAGFGKATPLGFLDANFGVWGVLLFVCCLLLGACFLWNVWSEGCGRCYWHARAQHDLITVHVQCMSSQGTHPHAQSSRLLVRRMPSGMSAGETSCMEAIKGTHSVRCGVLCLRCKHACSYSGTLICSEDAKSKHSISCQKAKRGFTSSLLLRTAFLWTGLTPSLNPALAEP